MWLVFLPITAFDGTAVVATLLHRDLFPHDGLGFRPWAVLHFVVPVVLSLPWYRNRRLSVGADAISDVEEIPPWWPAAYLDVEETEPDDDGTDRGVAPTTVHGRVSGTEVDRNGNILDTSTRFMYRKAAVILVVLLASLAGCSGSPAGEGTDERADDPSSAETGDVRIAEDRASALRAAGSYTVEWGMTYTEDGEVVGETGFTHAVDYSNERSYFEMRQTDGGDAGTEVERYYADGVDYTRYVDDGSYAVNDEAAFAPENSLFSPTVYTRSADDLEGYSRVGTETHDGVRVTRYELTDRPAWLAGQAPEEDFRWTEFTYVVLVDDDGLVRSESWSGEGVDDGGAEYVMTHHYTLTDVGSTTIESPDWLEEARAQAGGG